MRILAVTDGSEASVEAIMPLNGLVPIDLHVLPKTVPSTLRSAEVVLVCLARFRSKSFEGFFSWFANQGLARASFVLCMPAADIARFAHALREKKITAIPTPVKANNLFDALERSYRPFAQHRRRSANIGEKTAQAISNTFTSSMGANNLAPAKAAGQVSGAAPVVTKSIDVTGLAEWMQISAKHHSSTARHSMSSGGIASEWARQLGFSTIDRERFTRAALLQDIGKITIPVALLEKQSQLSIEDKATLQSHVEEGKKLLLEDPKACGVALEVAYSHHELLDGSGYPRGIGGSDINDITRCLTIIDVYSALVHQRAYRKGLTPMDAYDILVSMSGKLDPVFTNEFRVIIESHQAELKAAA
ncbi:MAG: HD-GYP domain-containing protein [Devosiaceae bacterium]